ncbi:hypothetical protein UPYG_G00038760 [Umbra pygmaea]|uniref:Uncharacterized protein n=1 Tax=Umbra pygmaea TaxID=75934 RepID=A0ABD0XPN1_UMBPY
MAGMEVPAQNVYVELSDDSDFESPVLQRRRVIQRDAVSTTQREHYERQEAVEASAPSDHGTGLQGQRGDNEATIHFADFIPIDVEEDEAIDEAIRRSLLEESVQSLQDSRFAKTLSKEEITGIVKAHSERVVTTNYRPIYIS